METRDLAYADWKAGMKYKAIAEKYNVTESAVKSWAARYWKPKDAKKLQPKRRGAPLGNQNAKGNTGGAPLGNRNSYIHGAYAFPYWDTLTPEEQESVRKASVASEEERLQGQLELLDARQQRLMREINNRRAILSSQGPDGGEALEHMGTLESELTRTQRAYSRIVCDLHRIRVDNKSQGVEESMSKMDEILKSIKESGG